MEMMAINLCLTVFLFLQLSGRCSPFPPFSQSGNLTTKGTSNSKVNCSNCRNLTNRIRQMQHMDRIKHRIMSALRNKGNTVPLADTPNTGSHTPSTTSSSAFGLSQNSTEMRTPASKVLIPRRKQHQYMSLISGSNHSTSQRNRSRNSLSNVEKSSSGVGTDAVASEAEKVQSVSRGNTKASLTERSGPIIFRFSKVVSSGKRKQVLQFKLSPAAEGEDLEVVNAHLWLLLTRLRPGESSEKTKANRKGSSGKSNRLTRTKNDKRRARRSRRDLEGEDRIGKNSSSAARRNRKGNDENTGQNEDEDERFRTVLRVTLVSQNGTKRLMTYLRTTVKMIHWQKVRLPVSMIQQKLQSSDSTLTLMIRCGRCGKAVRMVLPEGSRSKRKRARNRKRSKGKKKRGKGRGKRRRNKRDRRYGAKSRNSLSRQSVRKFQKKYRFLPFLVINTRVRSKVPQKT